MLLTELKNIIREELDKLHEDYRYSYGLTYIPTEDVVKCAKNALSAINKNNLIISDNKNEGSGINKCKSLIAMEPITHAQLKRMKAFFDNNEKDYKKEKLSSKTIENSGIIQKWNAWGGDAGQKWVEKEISKNNSYNNSSKTIRRGDGIGNTKNLMNPHNTRIHK